MKYIDKEAHLQAGRSITDQYLETTCKVDDGNGDYHYQNVDYDGTFGDTGAKDAMTRLALDNQENSAAIVCVTCTYRIKRRLWSILYHRAVM